MLFPGKKYLDFWLRAFAVSSLVIFLAFPEVVRAHPGIESVASKHEKSHDNTHESSLAEFSRHCHPGLDCFVSAILVWQPTTKIMNTVTRVPFVTHKHLREGRPTSFEPPPPRIRS